MTDRIGQVIRIVSYHLFGSMSSGLTAKQVEIIGIKQRSRMNRFNMRVTVDKNESAVKSCYREFDPLGWSGRMILSLTRMRSISDGFSHSN